MTDGIKPGARAYIIESNRVVRGVTIKRVSGSLCLVLLDHGGGIQIGKHRLFPTEDEAEAHLIEISRRRTMKHSYRNRMYGF